MKINETPSLDGRVVAVVYCDSASELPTPADNWVPYDTVAFVCPSSAKPFIAILNDSGAWSYDAGAEG